MTHRLLIGSALALSLAACSGEPSTKNEKVSTLPPVAPPMAIDGKAYDAAATVELPKTPPEEHPDLHNVYRLSDDIISGSEPHGEEAFKLLKAMNVRTILSVDGKVPDEEMAAKYGMKYVHVPIQYKGIADDELAKIAKTFREQEGPFFVHCFHGKHRGPAAAEVGRLVLDGIPRETAIAEMRQWCGTAQSYEGLYETIATADIPSEAATSAMKWDFPAASPLDGVRGAMILISRIEDNVKALSKIQWQVDPHHPDVDPLNEATKLMDVFERSMSLSEVAAQPDDYRQWMADSVEQAGELKAALAALKSGGGSVEAADAAYKKLSKTCSACHDTYRN